MQYSAGAIAHYYLFLVSEREGHFVTLSVYPNDARWIYI